MTPVRSQWSRYNLPRCMEFHWFRHLVVKPAVSPRLDATPCHGQAWASSQRVGNLGERRLLLYFHNSRMQSETHEHMWDSNWLVVDLPLWKMRKSIGMELNDSIKDVPNNQPTKNVVSAVAWNGFFFKSPVKVDDPGYHQFRNLPSCNILWISWNLTKSNP